MDSSDKKDIKDDQPTEKLERDATEHSEIKGTNSVTHGIRESVIKYCSSTSYQHESDRSQTENATDTKSVEICGSNKDETKIIENPSEKEETCSPKCKKISLTPTSSPMKRKSQQKAEDEIKRKRSTDNVPIDERNDGISTDSLNAALFVVPSENLQTHLASTVISNDNATERGIEEQGVDINQKDHSAIKCKISEATGETHSAHTSKAGVSNTRRSREHTRSEGSLSQQEKIIRNRHRRRSPRFKSLEHWANDPEFVESQKHILESISRQQKPLLSMKSESNNDKEKSSKSFINESPKKVSPEVPTEDEIEILLKEYRRLLRILKCCMKERKEDIKDLTRIELQYRLIILKDIIGEDDTNDPYLSVDYPENVTLSTAEEIAYERLFQERLEVDDRFPNPVALEDGSPDSSPPENQADDIPETDYSQFREDSGLAQVLHKIKKNARYQKIFYKQKNPVTLPINRSGDGASTSKIQENIDSEDNKIKIINDDPRIISRSNEVNVYEESEDPKILKDEDPLKEKRRSLEDKLSETSESASENKSPSMKTKTSTGVKDERYLKKLLKQPESPNRFPKKNPRTDVDESPNTSKSDSPKRNETESKSSTLDGISRLEGLAARFMSAASLISSSQAKKSQPPSSQSRPSEPKENNMD